MVLADLLNKSQFLKARCCQNSPIMPAGFIAAEHFLETQFFDISNLPADSLKKWEFCRNFKCSCYFLIVHLLSATARHSKREMLCQAAGFLDCWAIAWRLRNRVS